MYGCTWALHTGVSKKDAHKNQKDVVGKAWQTGVNRQKISESRLQDFVNKLAEAQCTLLSARVQLSPMHTVTIL